MTEVINVRVPEPIVRELEEWAHDEHRSRNNLVNKILTEAVERRRAAFGGARDDSE